MDRIQKLMKIQSDFQEISLNWLVENNHLNPDNPEGFDILDDAIDLYNEVTEYEETNEELEEHLIVFVACSRFEADLKGCFCV